MAAGTNDVDVDHDIASLRLYFVRAPGVWFHALVAVLALVLLYLHSVPGWPNFAAWGVVVLALVLAAGVWVARAVLFVWGRRKGLDVGSARWFLVAPIGGLIVVSLLVAAVPLRARWELSDDAFAAIVSDAPPATEKTEWVGFDVPSRIGSFEITAAYRVGDAVILYEKNGYLSDDAGFAYLPSGPFPELNTGSFESPRFRHLSGPWYAWVASW